MRYVGVDLGQFVADPQSSGIQRVLQQLARYWPDEHAQADFVVPYRENYLLLAPEQADALISLAFSATSGDQLRVEVAERIEALSSEAPLMDDGRLLALYGAWLLPEVSYLPSVLDRFERFSRIMPTTMIAYDVLPMSEPANYRLTPGVAARASEYFRLLARADSLVCISASTRADVWSRLRRDRARPISVAHPGGDHIDTAPPRDRRDGPTRFLRVGTLEARKMPVQIAEAFRVARADGVDAELVFVGRPSASESEINHAVEQACSAGVGISWIQDANDEDVARLIWEADVFLSLGVEGYGIPVLEAIRTRTPVIFAGVQPAAELMVGSGAVPAEGITEVDLTRTIQRFGDASARDELARQVDPEAVPTWREFARGVVDGILTA
jgi:glycosyltransferase involved in cell wall biosynthesis